MPLCVSVAGCAIWAGIVWSKDHLADSSVPSLTGFDVLQFAYIATIAFVGYFLGKRSRNAELAEIYADVILFWLKENCHTVCTFTTEHMAVKVALPVDKISLGLQRLQKHELLVKKPLFWEYSAVNASNISPGYGRLVGQETAARRKAVYDPLLMAQPLSALPVYAQDVDIETLCIARGVSYLVLTEEVFFLQLKIFSSSDAGFRGLKIRLSSEGNSYEGEAIADLSDWFLVKEQDAPIPYNRWQFTNMSELSLWKEIQEQGLKAGLRRTGWVAIRIPGLHHDLAKELTRIKIYIDRVGTSNRYRFIPDQKVPECEHKILSREMKQHRFGA